MLVRIKHSCATPPLRWENLFESCLIPVRSQIGNISFISSINLQRLLEASKTIVGYDEMRDGEELDLAN